MLAFSMTTFLSSVPNPGLISAGALYVTNQYCKNNFMLQSMFLQIGKKVTDLLVNYLGLTILKQWTAPSWKREQPSRLDGLHSSSEMKRPRSAIAWVILLGQGCMLGSSVDRNTEGVKKYLSSHAPPPTYSFFFGEEGGGGGSEYSRSVTKK